MRRSAEKETSSSGSGAAQERGVRSLASARRSSRSSSDESNFRTSCTAHWTAMLLSHSIRHISRARPCIGSNEGRRRRGSDFDVTAFRAVRRRLRLLLPLLLMAAVMRASVGLTCCTCDCSLWWCSAGCVPSDYCSSQRRAAVCVVDRVARLQRNSAQRTAASSSDDSVTDGSSATLRVGDDECGRERRRRRTTVAPLAASASPLHRIASTPAAARPLALQIRLRQPIAG